MKKVIVLVVTLMLVMTMNAMAEVRRNESYFTLGEVFSVYVDFGEPIVIEDKICSYCCHEGDDYQVVEVKDQDKESVKLLYFYSSGTHMCIIDGKFVEVHVVPCLQAITPDGEEKIINTWYKFEKTVG